MADEKDARAAKLMEAVDALIARGPVLPAPAERKRLRVAHGLSQQDVADALDVRRATVVNWESGRTEPRGPERDAYARLLETLAKLYPAPAETSATAPQPAEPAPAGSTKRSAPSSAPSASSMPPRILAQHTAGATEEQLHATLAARLGHAYFQDRGRRAQGLDVTVNDIDYLDVDVS
jgi:DNA-binding transcriptional regulator YiaG